ncbi:hypothetical protein SAMN04489806_2720 [Paramicrobacterium humi]|uniref:Uncharacterized protein n=1 Tax=Paramicrobacterium humi TaxID=640635 RepID=A0A1H4Q5M8_9MICO|nr:zinc ribbon domain-containing protein [Microbacterium humi]SEC14956.1 hypothetical protein SAMN04489806_2720 [Microbacterium humi]
MAFRGHPGRNWPSSPWAFVDTRLCPACFAPLRGTVCPACDLDLNAPEAAELFAASRRLVDAEESRQQILSRMRDRQSWHEASRATPNERPAAASPAPPLPVPTPSAVPAPARQEPARPRRSTVQILLLTVGVVLVSVAAIFFLVVAYLIASLAIRSVLTAALGLAIIAATWLLARRSYTATAEGVGVVGTVFLVLDVWIVRANDVFGSSAMPPWPYAALSLALLTAVLVAARVLTHVRSYAVTGIMLGAGAAFSAGVSLFPHGAAASRSWTGFLAVSVLALAWPLLRRHRPEMVTARTLAAVSSVLALPFATASWPSLQWGTTIAFLATAAVFTAHLWYSPVATAPRRADPELVTLTPQPQAAAPPLTTTQRLGAWKTSAGVGIGLALAGAATAPTVHMSSIAAQLIVPSTLTAAFAILLAAVARLSRATASGAGMRVASDVVLAVCGLVAIPALGTAAVEAVARVAITNFSLPALASVQPVLPQLEYAPPITLACLTIAIASTLALRGLLRRLGWLPLGTGALAIAVWAVIIPIPLGSTAVLAGLTIASTALFALLRPRRGRRIVLAIIVIGASLLSYVLGANSSGAWPFAAIVAIGALTTFRLSMPARVKLADRLATGPIVTAVLVTVVLVTARWAPVWIGTLVGGGGGALPALTLVLAAATTVALAAILLTRLPAPDCSVMAVIGGISAVLGMIELTAGRIGDPAPYLAGLAAVLLAQIAWHITPGARERVGRYVTAALVPPTAILLAVESWRVFGPSVWGAPELITAGLSLVLAGLGLVLFRGDHFAPTGDPRSHPARLCWDAAIALTAVVTVPSALTTSDFGPLNLFFLGLIPLLFAAGEGDLVSGTSLRRHVAWVSPPWLAAALWLLLAQHGVELIEVYSLPLAALLGLILALIAWRQPVRETEVPSGRNMLAIVAIGIAAIPSIAVAASGTLWRPAVLVAIGVALALGAPALASLWRGIRAALWLWSAGLAIAAIAGCTQAFRLISHSAPAVPIEAWLVPVAVALTVGGILWRTKSHTPAVLGQIAVASAPAVIGIPLANLAAVSEVPVWRLSLVGCAIIAYFVAASTPRLAPRAVAVRWTSAGSTAFLCIGAMAGGLDPIEAVTVPVAVGAIVGGVLRLQADRTQRSWRHLGAGLAVLLLPSLALDLVDGVLWRLVGLGVVALAVLVGGVFARLQAPVVLGAGVLIVHGLAHLWPWISVAYHATPWWLWAGAGGVILIVIAASYEKRVRELRAVARSVSALR